MKIYNPYKLFVGSFIPNWLMCRGEVSPGAKLCFARLAQFAGADGACYPSQTRIAKELGISERNARRYIKELEGHALITCTHRGLNRPNVYQFLWHEWMDSGPDKSVRSGEDKSVRSGADESVRSDRTNPSGLERTNLSGEENQLRESVKRGGTPEVEKEELPDAEEAMRQIIANLGG